MMPQLVVSKVDYKIQSIYDNKELEPLIKLMEEMGVENPKGLLPKVPDEDVRFTLTNTNSSFANAVRRILLEEIPGVCLDVDYKDIDSDDDFKLDDVLIKQINLLHIKQETRDGEFDQTYSGSTIFLYKYNNTNRAMNVTAKDLRITKHKPIDEMTKDYYVKSIKTGDLVPNPNVVLHRLRPGRFLYIKKIFFSRGITAEDGARFSLLHSLYYEPLGPTPFNNFKHAGNRSINTNYTSFKIGYSTNGNIKPKTVHRKLIDVLKGKVLKVRQLINDHIDAKKEGKTATGIHVRFINNIYEYRIDNEYITLSYILAHQCFEMDKTTPLLVPGIDRLDNNIAIIKIKSPTPNKVLIAGCDELLKKIAILDKALQQ